MADRDAGMRFDIGGFEVTHRELDLGEPLMRDRERDAIAEARRELLGVLQIFDRFAAPPHRAFDFAGARQYVGERELVADLLCERACFAEQLEGKLVVAVFGWTGGKLLVGQSYGDAKVKVAEQKAQRAAKKEAKRAAKEDE